MVPLALVTGAIIVAIQAVPPIPSGAHLDGSPTPLPPSAYVVRAAEVTVQAWLPESLSPLQEPAARARAVRDPVGLREFFASRGGPGLVTAALVRRRLPGGEFRNSLTVGRPLQDPAHLRRLRDALSADAGGSPTPGDGAIDGGPIRFLPDDLFVGELDQVEVALVRFLESP